MTKEEFKAEVSELCMAYEWYRCTWEQFLEKLWQLHVQDPQNGLGSKNCADCAVAEYPPCNKGIPCCKCGDECNSRQPCPKKGGEK